MINTLTPWLIAEIIAVFIYIHRDGLRRAAAAQRREETKRCEEECRPFMSLNSTPFDLLIVEDEDAREAA